MNDQTDTGSGVVITTSLPETDNKNDNGHTDGDNDDLNDNVGFEKLSGDGDKVGLVVLKLRSQLVGLIAKRKVWRKVISHRILSFVVYFRKLLFMHWKFYV